MIHNIIQTLLQLLLFIIRFVEYSSVKFLNSKAATPSVVRVSDRIYWNILLVKFLNGKAATTSVVRVGDRIYRMLIVKGKKENQGNTFGDVKDT